MSYSGRVIRAQDLFSSGETCGCGRPVRAEHSLGPLLYRSDPDEMFWRGRRMEVQPTQARLMSLLIRFGMCRHEDLILAMPKATSGYSALHVHMSFLRKALRRETDGDAWIVSARGSGYRLMLEM
jgi:DNA-binding response OmpR family regulator